MRNSRGFTLMELMIVIAIIMILSAAIVARMTTGSERAKYAKANGEMAEIAAAVRSFYLDVGYWPYNNIWDSLTGDAGLISKDNIASLQSDSGSAVAVTDAIKAKWKGPYLEAMEWPKDPWGTGRYLIYYYSAAPKAIYVLCKGPDNISNGWNWSTGVVDAGSDSIQLLVHRF